MARRRARRPAAGRPRITFYWDNPPGPTSGGSIERVWRGQVYEREVGPGDWLDVPEAAAALGVRHVFSVYRAIWDGRLEAIHHGRDIRVSLAAIKSYLKQEASRPGRKGRRRLRE
jgi:excisionase family DNA binding protein